MTRETPKNVNVIRDGNPVVIRDSLKHANVIRDGDPVVNRESIMCVWLFTVKEKISKPNPPTSPYPAKFRSVISKIA